MKRTFILAAMLTAALCGCNGGAKNQETAQQPAETETQTQPAEPKTETPSQNANASNADKSVDWEKPLYSINDETGDTLQKWVYDGNTVTEYSMGDYGDGSTTYKYDTNHRLISEDGDINTGNIHRSGMAYTYQDKKRYGTGQQSTDGYSYYTEIDEIAWYADDNYTLDTLIMTLTCEMEWEEDGEKDKEVESSTVKKYKDGKLIEQTTYGCDYTNVKDPAQHFRSKIIYKYYSDGMLKSETIVDKDGNPMGEYATTTYTYKGNARISTDTGTGETTYYAKK